MTRDRSKTEIVNTGMRDAWLGAGLEVPAASHDPGAKARRIGSEGDRRKQAAALKRQRKAEQKKRRAAGLV